MSSTYVHYSTPSSLPSDYALLSRYAAAHDLNSAEEENINDAGPSTDIEDYDEDHDAHGIDINGQPRKPRRRSFPSSYLTPFNPTMGPLPDRHGHRSGPYPREANENTPLLAPPVPRIEEECDGEDATESLSTSKLFREEIRILTKYTIPVFGTHLFEYSLVVASVISIGHLSTTALAASTLGSMTASVSGFSIIQGFASTLDTMLPSAWTSSQPQLVGLWAQRMGEQKRTPRSTGSHTFVVPPVVVMAAALVPILCIWWSSESILLFLKQEPEVARLAAVYLKWSSLGLPAYAFNSISRRYFQSQGLFTVPTHIILGVAPVNALLNYLLVWGPDPIRLGFIGAPIATAISFNLISILSVIYGIFFVPKTAWHPLSMRCFTSLGVLVQLGLSGVGQVASEWWSWELIGLAASQLGPTALATQSVLLVSASTTYQAPFALSVAASVRIGNLLGEENPKRASVASKCAILMSLVISAVWSTMFIVSRTQWAHLFNDDPEVVSLVASILPLVALFQVFDGLSAITSGILRAIGKQFTGALLNLSAYYVVGIPFGIWLAFWRDMHLHGLWVGLTVSLVYSAATGNWICLRTDWVREVEKVRVRLEADRKQTNGHGDVEVAQ